MFIVGKSFFSETLYKFNIKTIAPLFVWSLQIFHLKWHISVPRPRLKNIYTHCFLQFWKLTNAKKLLFFWPRGQIAILDGCSDPSPMGQWLDSPGLPHQQNGQCGRPITDREIWKTNLIMYALHVYYHSIWQSFSIYCTEFLFSFYRNLH